jgi:translation initiation factor 4A
VETLSSQIQERDFVVSYMHDDMDKTQREFRTGSNRVLITTDLLPHGFDVQQVPLVINYDMPASFESYLYRISRIGSLDRSARF